MSAPHVEPRSLMLETVVAYIKDSELSHDRLALQCNVPSGWIRSVRENRTQKPDINRVEHIFINFCNGTVQVAK